MNRAQVQVNNNNNNNKLDFKSNCNQLCTQVILTGICCPALGLHWYKMP